MTPVCWKHQETSAAARAALPDFWEPRPTFSQRGVNIKNFKLLYLIEYTNKKAWKNNNIQLKMFIKINSTPYIIETFYLKRVSMNFV